MNRETRRPRMCGLRRGRGVRVRGGRGGGGPPLMADASVGMVVVADRSDASGRGRRRGGRVDVRHERRTIDELVISDIAMPECRDLEIAMHPKTMRMWQPSNPAPRPLALPLVAPTSPSVAPTSPSVSYLVPSPALFVECGDHQSPTASPTSLPPPRRPQHLRNEDFLFLINHGSDEDSDSADDEESGAIPVVPRVFWTMMETSFDAEEQAADTATPDMTKTEMPWDLYDFNWRAFPNPPIAPKLRRETFSETNVGPPTPSTDPYDIFIEIWDRQIMEHIASETNKYAQQVATQLLKSGNLHPRSRINRWRDVTTDELYVYFGITLAMGVVVKTRVEEYWGSTPDIFYTPGFSAQMSVDRYFIINKCLHFNDNNNMCALELEYSEARLFKIRPILLHLNRKFQELYTPSQNISLDESLLMWKGSLEICQIIPNKAANRGIKTYEICESQTGYLWRFEIHAHKKSPQQKIQDPLLAATPAIVLKLIEGLEYKGYTLWMDNFYQSPALARRLKCLGFDCVGTLRTDRRFVPQALNSLTKQNMRPGQITGLTSGDVDVMVWRDTNRVAMISTYHGNSQQTTRGSTKPILILDYNIMMGGVDKKDQLLAMYPVERKRTKVWYKKVFRRLLNISVLNSYIIHHHTSTLNHRNFRTNLIKSLLTKHSSPATISPATTQKKIDFTHRIDEFPMRKHQRLRRACTACKKQVRTFCVGCSKTVCMEPCFHTIHS